MRLSTVAEGVRRAVMSAAGGRLPGRWKLREDNCDMRWLTTSLSTPMTSALVRQARLLLMLTAALAGFFLLLEFLVSLLSSGPRDILATTSFQEESLGLPNGVGLLEAAVLGVSAVLALAVLIAAIGWPPARASFRPSVPLAAGVLAALAIAGAGAYLALSGLVGREIAYSEHQVHRSFLESDALALVAVVFLSLIIAGFINRYALAIVVVALLLAAPAVGLLDTRPVDGLYLFERPEFLEAPPGYTYEVERRQRTDAPLVEEPTPEPETPAEVEAPQSPGVSAVVAPSVTADQSESPEPLPVFWVSGAFHTRYLRTATGDVYENGAWTQVDPGFLPADEGAQVPHDVLAALEQLRAAGEGGLPPERLDQALLVYPTAEHTELVPDVIVVTPYLEGALFGAGSVPSADFLFTVDVPASYHPFSATLSVPGPTGAYRLETTIPRFAPDDMLAAAPAADPAYLQLPEGLPSRVLELAEQFNTDEPPYIRAIRVNSYLRENYAYARPEDGPVVRERPAGHDPVDWFLFERRWGGSSHFSSAFVVLARAAGIPARVVAGWAIESAAEPQVVKADQAHQWAEIALDGIGWVRFDPTLIDAFPPETEAEAEPLPTLVEELKSSEDPQVREEAAQTLGDLGEPEALPALIEAAEHDRSLAVQLAAETAIHKIGVDELIWLSLNHEDPVIREAAVDALRVASSHRSVDALRQALATDEDSRVREASAEALAKIGGEKAEQALLDAALNDEEAVVREAAVRGLGTQKADWTAEELADLLGSDPAATVRVAAAEALGEFQDPVALRALLDAMSNDPDRDVRSAARRALAEWEVGDLVEILLDDDDPALRAAAAEVFGSRQSFDAVPALTLALSDPDESVRNAALKALGSYGPATQLENGAFTLRFGDLVGVIPRATASRSPEPDSEGVFEVTGARSTTLLRVAVGDVYVDGQWLAVPQTRLPQSSHQQVSHGAIAPGVAPHTLHRDTIDVHAFAPPPLVSLRILTGLVPTSAHLESVSVPGTFFPESAAFTLEHPVRSYTWTAEVHDYSEAQLTTAGKWSAPINSPYTGLPEWARSGPVYDLAAQITAGHSSPYAQAQAIADYLRANYTYAFADDGDQLETPEVTDPVERFLFVDREGTCGNFSSAFVFLARAIGLPARVVSGWAISATPVSQIVYTDQAHQWAEVAFEGLGWVTFDPTPAGPNARAARAAPPTGDQEKLEEALQSLEESGAEVVRLENGGALVLENDSNDGDDQDNQGDADGDNQDGQDDDGGGPIRIGWVASGRQVRQASELLAVPVFRVEGAGNTSYIRTAVGDVYENGGWRQLDPVLITAPQGASVPDAVWSHYIDSASEFFLLPFERRSSGSLFGIRQAPHRVRNDQIRLFPLEDYDFLPFRVMPVSPDLQHGSVGGGYFPFSGTYHIADIVPEYSYTSRIVSYSHEEYLSATAATDPTYLQLPPTLPDRVQELAERVTAGHRSPYAKAKALETYLRTTYPYRLADSPDDHPPPGHDPVDWFLFEHREGTCGVFSSAFAVMARSVGIPARVVSGWAIRAQNEPQTVLAMQAHQWAEIALNGIGWVEFEPTGSADGPLARAYRDTQILPPPPPAPLDTVTTITQSPSDIRRQQPFTVGGWVKSVTGRFVDGMKVEVYVNETKEHGGMKIGETVTHHGRYEVEVQLPPSLELGSWQLLARAVEMDGFNESWSDPDITVFSASGLRLTGPSKVPVDVEAVFTGRLSEDTGAGVADREITVAVNGAAVDSVMTDASGRFTFSQVFADPGPHWVEVELKGQAFLLDNRARIDFEVTLPTDITVRAPVAVEVGEEFRLYGSLRGVRGEPLTGRGIAVRVGDRPVQRVSTDDDGIYQLIAAFDEPGPFAVVAEFAGDGPILASAATAGVAVRETSLLVVEGPSTVELGDGGAFAGRLAKADGSPIGQSALSIVDADGAELATVTTDDDGTFQYDHEAFFQTGPHSLSVLYPGSDFIVPSSARMAFSVLAPTRLSLEAPAIVRDGESLTVSGTLLDVNGQPVPAAEVEVVGDIPLTLVTDAGGAFRWETVAAFDESLSGSPHESPLVVEVAFSGTDRLAPSAAATEVVVGLPQLLLEPLEPVARGSALTLRGTALLGVRPAPDLELTVGGDAVRTDAAGAFAYTHHVPGDAPLGSSELTVAAESLDVSAVASFVVKSAVNMTVSPLDTVRPGKLAVMEVRLLNDRGRSLRRAVMRLDDGTALAADDFGVALLEVPVPDDEDALTLPLTFTFDGDERHMPLTYFIGLPVTPFGFNWLLWVGAPGAAVALAAAGYAGSRMRLVPVPGFLARRREEDDAGEALALGTEEGEDEEPAETRVRVALDMEFGKPAPDLPDVWGVGETVAIALRAVDPDGLPVAGVEVRAAVAGEEPEALVAGDDGVRALQWTAAEVGDYRVVAEFAGNEACLPASVSRTFRVVDFREEIVRLYNVFLEWASRRTSASVDQMTPREVELLIVSRGLPVPQKSLDELISRFEEADYSEHPIARRHYESMYRAWRAVVEDEPW